MQEDIDNSCGCHFLLAMISFARLAGADSRRPSRRWRFEADDWVIALAVGRDGSVYAATQTGNTIYAVGRDGALRRKFSASSAVFQLAVGNDGAIYARTPTGVAAFNPDGDRSSAKEALEKSLPCESALILFPSPQESLDWHDETWLSPQPVLERDFENPRLFRSAVPCPGVMP